jgi:hypothetical protein
MTVPVPISRLRPAVHSSVGSILIYVLWILAVISVLAFQLTADSRTTSLNQSAFANQLKKQMQIESAIQFAMFKIASDLWQHRTYTFSLNDQQFAISIFNEAGFVSIYEVDNPTLANIFKSVELDDTSITELKSAVSDEDQPQRFNSFAELKQIPGFDDDVLARLKPMISVFHEDPVNPMLSPPQVLMKFHRVDQFRVRKLFQDLEQDEIEQLRTELVESLRQQNVELSDDLSAYYRVHIVIDGLLHRVFLKKPRQQARYTVLLIEYNQLNPDAIAS